jgi:pimeloyl-[acyl-carrier protein] methyl ester esterase
MNTPGKLKTVTAGRGPDLVMLHGWAMNSGIWGGIVDRLSEDYRVTLVDLPGHGLNRGIDLVPDLDALAGRILAETPPARWLGWSLGGLVTLAAALRQPEKVKGTILVSATPSFAQQPDWQCGLDQAGREAFMNGLARDHEGAVQAFHMNMFGSFAREAARRLETGTHGAPLPEVAVLEAGLRILYENNLLSELPGITTPTLVMGGTRDRVVRSDAFKRTAEMMPHARLHLIPGAGHVPFATHPDQFLDVVRAFLREDHEA